MPGYCLPNIKKNDSKNQVDDLKSDRHKSDRHKLSWTVKANPA